MQGCGGACHRGFPGRRVVASTDPQGPAGTRSCADALAAPQPRSLPCLPPLRPHGDLPAGGLSGQQQGESLPWVTGDSSPRSQPTAALSEPRHCARSVMRGPSLGYSALRHVISRSGWKTQRDEVHGDCGGSGHRSGWEEVETTDSEPSGSRAPLPRPCRPRLCGLLGLQLRPQAGGQDLPESVSPARLPRTLTRISQKPSWPAGGPVAPTQMLIKETGQRGGRFVWRSQMGSHWPGSPRAVSTGEPQCLRVPPVHASLCVGARFVRRVLRRHL